MLLQFPPGLALPFEELLVLDVEYRILNLKFLVSFKKVALVWDFNAHVCEICPWLDSV